MFAHGGKERTVFRLGQGPAVIVIAEMPGITPNVAGFARRVASIVCSLRSREFVVADEAANPDAFGTPHSVLTEHLIDEPVNQPALPWSRCSSCSAPAWSTPAGCDDAAVSDLPPEYLDPNTPPDVVITDTAPPRITDPTLGVELGESPGGVVTPPAEPAHALVTIGDSLTHGVSSGAVFHTALSWPAQVATATGAADFDVPSYGGPLDGLPINLEKLLRRAETSFGEDISVFERLRAPLVLHRIVDSNEDYWERGAGSDPPAQHIRYHNLGIYGWDLRDALSFTSGRAAAGSSASQRDNLLGAKPDGDNDIAAHSVLAPFGIDATQVRAAAAHGADGGIGTLVVALGSNNALDAVVSKEVKWSDAGFDDLDVKGKYNVWTPTHFAHEYAALVGEIKQIPAQRVLLATVPHVTIAPIAKGVNPDRPGEKWRDGSRYFPYYTDPWMDEDDFRPSRHRHLTHAQARAIDSAIDQFNTTITDAVRHARSEGRDWYVIDLCGLLDSLAYRRFIRDAEAAERNEWVEYRLPAPIAHLDTQMFRANEHGRYRGGLFGLDAIHPSISAYGVLAKEVLEVLSVAGVASTPIDFTALLAKDSLNADPPALVDDVLGLIAPFATRFVSRT